MQSIISDYFASLCRKEEAILHTRQIGTYLCAAAAAAAPPPTGMPELWLSSVAWMLLLMWVMRELLSLAETPLLVPMEHHGSS
jgi:hypothetical protein